MDRPLRAGAGGAEGAAVTNLDAAIEYLDQAITAMVAAHDEIDPNDPDLIYTRYKIVTAHTMTDANRSMLVITREKRGEAVQP